MTKDEIDRLPNGLKPLGNGLYIRVHGRTRRYLERHKKAWTPIGYHPGVTYSDAVEKAAAIRAARLPAVVRVVEIQPLLLTLTEVCNAARCSLRTIHQYIDAGVLPVVELGPSLHDVRVRLDDARSWIAALPAKKIKPVCMREGCSNPVHAGGYCLVHSQRLRINTKLPVDAPVRRDCRIPEVTPVPSLCSIEGCGRKLAGYGLCQQHLRRRRTGQPLDTPIRHRSKPQPPQEALDSMAVVSLVMDGPGALK